MNKNLTRNILRVFLLLAIALSSGCGAVTAIPTSKPSQTPTVSSPTNTPQPIQPEGILIYSTGKGVFSFNLQKKEVNVISSSDKKQYHSVVIKNSIYVLRDTKGDGTQAEIFKMKLDGTDLEQLTFDGNKYGFEVSPNGDYLSYSLETNQLKLFDVANKTSQTIAQQDGYFYSSPSWSPDSSKFAYFSSMQLERPVGQLFLYSQENKFTKQFLPGMIIYTTSTTWSPNGENIILNIEYDPQTGTQGIFILNVNSNQLEQIADKATGNGFVFSPNGNMILYVDNLGQLVLFEQKNKSVKIIQKKIPEQQTLSDLLLWSPKGDYIGYITCPIENRFKCFFNIRTVDNKKISEFEFPAENWIQNIFWTQSN
ncbi:MAG: hypothetical protein U0Z26_10885 [Anaerolineales bacterium]